MGSNPAIPTSFGVESATTVQRGPTNPVGPSPLCAIQRRRSRKPVRLLDTQLNEIRDVIDESPFENADIEIAQETSGDRVSRAEITVLRFKRKHLFRLTIPGADPGFQVKRLPGKAQLEDGARISGWVNVLAYIADWLRFIKRELAAADRGGGNESTPDWAISQLPIVYADTVREIDRLQENERRFRRMAGLMWEVGDSLAKLGRDAFRQVSLPAEITMPGETYDVTVTLPAGRLLIEVTNRETSCERL